MECDDVVGSDGIWCIPERARSLSRERLGTLVMHT